MSGLSAPAREFINRFQGGFPLSGCPFSRVAAQLGTTETALISLIRGLLDAGHLSRFGPLYDAARLGGGQTLAAMAVPERRFARVAGQVNALPAVAHNYRREHRLNMWFVISTADAAGVGETLAEIERRTGLPVYDFPKEREFYLGLWLRLGEDGEVDTVPAPPGRSLPAFPIDALDRRIIAATQAGLPLVSEPAEDIARQVDAPTGRVIERLERMLAGGVIRRVGAVPNHYRLGLRGNGMTVWDLPDALAGELGERVGALDFVSHAYLRPRHAGVWPYNLFAMVHGRDRDQVRAKTRAISELLGDHCRAHDVLFSTEILKKTGLRLVA